MKNEEPKPATDLRRAVALQCLGPQAAEVEKKTSVNRCPQGSCALTGGFCSCITVHLQMSSPPEKAKARAVSFIYCAFYSLSVQDSAQDMVVT